ncbi:MAG: hypothetical protein HY680_07635 [Chloroflexi bacterium]|nr:hypothetical protein [Chloroflexota bacterium]
MNWAAIVFKWWTITTVAPPFLKFMFVALGAMLSSQPDAVDRVVESWADLFVAVIIPWWLNPLAFLASLPGLLGGLLALAFIILLLKTGHLSPE